MVSQQNSIRRYLYEHSVSDRGYLIIPFVFGIASELIYSYTLLSELGHQGKFHKFENPAKLYSSSINQIIEVAKQHLKQYSDVESNRNYFQYRYTYLQHLIIIHEVNDRCFYDHYLPDKLNNIAAPKLFKSITDCVNWVKHGLERNYIGYQEIGE